VGDLVLAEASIHDAAAMVEVIHAAFSARPPLDPPSTAVDETEATIIEHLDEGTAVFATVDGHPAGVILVSPLSPDLAGLQRVSVHPRFQRHGVASAMVDLALELAASRGHRRVELFVRGEFEQLVDFWRRRGFHVDRPVEYGVILTRRLPIAIGVPTAEAMHALGRRLATRLRAGDLVIASGDLGAGKTTLTQGLGAGLNVDRPIISPTFVLSRIHPARGRGPDLVHVDAYRLGSPAELDDLDLDATQDRSVTVVEWGAGIAEDLSEDRLEIEIRRDSPDSDHRCVRITPVGKRWEGVDL
jgi:tRNA threonylcarbamoyladenosine biosynthesis protein TsaE